jgi:ubiquinone/menaquinone biosynthesis C-methylase UbiE
MLPDKKEVQRRYDDFADKVTMSRKFYLACARLISGGRGRVLDLGCGQGHLLARLPRVEGLRMYGFDFSYELSRRSKENNPDCGIVQADAEYLPYKTGAFSRILFTEVLPYIPDADKAFVEISRVLEPGGRVLVTGINREWLRYEDYQRKRTTFQPVDEHSLSFGEVERLLKLNGIRVLKVRGTENLYAGGGLPRLIERLVMLVYPPLHKKTKRLMVLGEKI